MPPLSPVPQAIDDNADSKDKPRPTEPLDESESKQPAVEPATKDDLSAALSYPLGADDISKIVDPLLLQLSPFLPNLTKDQQYVSLHKAVLKLSKGKTFTNKHDLDVLVKDIVKRIVNRIIKTVSKIQATPSCQKTTGANAAVSNNSPCSGPTANGTTASFSQLTGKPTNGGGGFTSISNLLNSFF